MKKKHTTIKNGITGNRSMIKSIKGTIPKGDFREMLRFYLIDSKTPLGKIIDIVIILLNFLICAIFVIETYPVSASVSAILWKVEVITVSFFIIEYLVRFYAARKKLRHIVNPYSIIDLVAILPTLSLLLLPLFGISVNIGVIKLIRVFRVFRIFRFLRFTADPNFFFGQITIHLLKVIQLVITIMIIFFVSSGLFYIVESPVNNQVKTFGDAFYFTVVALTTVGFGDIIPVSEWGRMVTVLMIISGIILIPWQASLIIREWLEISDKKRAVCPQCGLRSHDKDASHCKSCGHVIYQEHDEN